MFNDLPLCCDYSAAATAAAVNGAPGPVASTSGYTASGRTVAFPMVDPYGPVRKAGVPVSGYNRFPVRRSLGKKYYGLSGVRSSGGLKGFGDDAGGGEPYILVRGDGPPPNTITSQGVRLPPAQPATSTLQSILNAILPAAPAIISASRGNPYYNPAQLVPAQRQSTVLGTPLTSAGNLTSAGATAGAAVGNLGAATMSIIEQNPLLVLGGAVALFLLFKQPPSRR